MQHGIIILFCPQPVPLKNCHVEKCLKVFVLFISFAQWFCEGAALETDDAIEKQKVYKFRGDLAMRKGNYQVNKTNTLILTF